MTARPPTIHIDHARYDGAYLERLCEQAAALIGALGRHMPENVRRANYPSPGPDGYPLGGTGGGSRGKGEVPDPTASAVVTRNGSDPPDPMVESCRAIGQYIFRIWDMATWATTLQDSLSAPSRSSGGVQGICLGCGRVALGGAWDGLRGGLDSACYTAWRRDGQPDIARWCRLRQKWSSLPEPRILWSKYACGVR